MTNEIANDDWPIFAVTVTNPKQNRSMVFALLRQALNIGPAVAKELLDSSRVEVARGPRILVEPVAVRFRSAGAEVEITPAPDEVDKG
jgi:hypothetical protein